MIRVRGSQGKLEDMAMKQSGVKTLGAAWDGEAEGRGKAGLRARSQE